MRKNTDRKKTLSEAEVHLKYLKYQVGDSKVDQVLLSIQIENTESLIFSIKNNEPLLG